jgi:hypothetical protein
MRAEDDALKAESAIVGYSCRFRYVATTSLLVSGSVKERLPTALTVCLPSGSVQEVMPETPKSPVSAS